MLWPQSNMTRGNAVVRDGVKAVKPEALCCANKRLGISVLLFVTAAPLQLVK